MAYISNLEDLRHLTVYRAANYLHLLTGESWLESLPCPSPACCAQDLDAGPVQTVAFSAVASAPPKRGTAGELEVFAAPDFVVSSRTGNIVAVRASSFDDASGEEPSHQLLVQVCCPAAQPLPVSSPTILQLDKQDRAFSLPKFYVFVKLAPNW